MKPIAFATLAVASLVASEARAQRELPSPNELSCNALCRAYLGSHYRPPEPEAVAEGSAADPGIDVPLAPPRPASLPKAGVTRRLAAIPPARPHELGDAPPNSAEVRIALPPAAEPDPELSPAIREASEAAPARNERAPGVADMVIGLPPDVGQVSLDAGALVADRDDPSTATAGEHE